MTTLENPVYYSGQAGLRNEGSETRRGEGPSLRSQKESQPGARLRCPREPGEVPAPPRVLWGPPWAAAPDPQHRCQGQPRAAAAPPAAGLGTSGEGAGWSRKDLCVAGAHPRSRGKRLWAAPRGSSARRPPPLRKGRDREVTSGAGEDPGARGSGQGLGAAPGGAPPQPRAGEAPRLSRAQRNLLRPGAPAWVRLGRGAPWCPARGPAALRSREAQSRTEPFPRGPGEGTPQPVIPDPRGDSGPCMSGGEDPGVMLKKESPRRGLRGPSPQVPCAVMLPSRVARDRCHSPSLPRKLRLALEATHSRTSPDVGAASSAPRNEGGVLSTCPQPGYSRGADQPCTEGPSWHAGHRQPCLAACQSRDQGKSQGSRRRSHTPLARPRATLSLVPRSLA